VTANADILMIIRPKKKPEYYDDFIKCFSDMDELYKEYIEFFYKEGN
jgi:hypothetical protein